MAVATRVAGAARGAPIGLGLVLLPLAISAVVLVGIGSDYLATADIALTELRTRDVGRHAVLLGPYSREGWNHFGPAMFLLLAPPYRLFGSHAAGLAVGALVVNGAAIAGMALVARRVAGAVPMLLTLVGCAVLVGSLGPDLVRDPWNPYITVLPFGLVLFLSWAMTCGHRFALPVGAAVATFCVQTHVGYLPLVLPLVVWGLGGLLLAEARRQLPEEASGRWWRRLVPVAGATALVLAVLWLPPFIEQMTGHPGNLTEVTRYFSSSEESSPSLVEAIRAVGGQFEPAPQWVTGDLDISSFTSEPTLLDRNPRPLLLVAFAAGWLVLHRRGMRAATRLAATLAVALVAGVASVARTLGPAYAYRLRWTWVLGMVAVLIAVWALWVVAERRWARAGPLLASGALAGLAVLGVTNGVRAGGSDVPYEARSDVMQALAPALDRALPAAAGDDEILVQTTSFAGTFYRSGVVLWLERRGVEARVSPSDVDDDAFGSHRVLDEEPAAVWTVAVDREVEVVAERPGHELIAYWGVLSRDERARLVARRSRLDADHAAGRYDDAEYLRRALALEPGRAIAVFASPPPDG